MARSFFKKLFFLLTRPVYFGRFFESVPDGSLVIFPCSSNRLCCGLAGIIECKRGSKKVSREITQKGIHHIKELWSGMCKQGLKELLRGEGAYGAYLGGDDPIDEFKSSIIALKGINAFEQVFTEDALQTDIRALTEEITAFLTHEDALLDKSGSKILSSGLEMVNKRLIEIRDCLWWMEKEIVVNVKKVSGLISQSERNSGLIREMFKVNITLNTIDRLEIRGRDSAGICVLISFPDKGGADAFETSLKKCGGGLFKEYGTRMQLRDSVNKSILANGTRICFLFKTARELGQLGDNVAFLRDVITHDPIFHLALSQPGISMQAMAHTRWASVGDITEVNCHPVDNGTDTAQMCGFSIHVALNGDIDNYKGLKHRLEKEDNIHIQPRITTDTKVIPLWVGHYIKKGHPLQEAFRLAVSDFEGSHAIALQSDSEPDHIYLAQRGSGQAIFIGLAEDCYVAASEVYGLVEQTPYYIKLDGEKERIQGRPETQGQIFRIDSKGGLEGLYAWYYDGEPIYIDNSLIKTAQITTRDIDRQGFPHYYLKEVGQAPVSVQKTIRGKVLLEKRDDTRHVTFNLGEEILPSRIIDALRSGKIRNIYLVGQGTAGVAGEGIAMLMSEYLSNSNISIKATKASELSGFGIDRSLSDTLVLAVTQSGTTTDTNKAVDLARNHGAFTMAIVNRRDSDISTKVDGVFYTSDGRDIEMSVASTKAFYSQIVAGCIIGLRLAQALGTRPDSYITNEIRQLMLLPKLMTRIIAEQSDAIADAARSLALSKGNWAVVGSGPNKVAADEIRIKLSELCYKTLPADVVEDRKHIDLSAEPLIIVCAAGNRETVLGDVIKDTAIFKAHQATVIAIATEGEERFTGLADATFFVPHTNERLAPILNTVAGHLWGYYVARALNEEADFFRLFKSHLHEKMDILCSLGEKGADMIYDREIRMLLKDFVKEAMLRKQDGRFDSALLPQSLCNLAIACRYALGQIPPNEMVNDIGPRAEHTDPLTLLHQMVDEVIDQLSRPIDAIKHQAKTVTVGTSRLPVLLTGVIFDTLPKFGFGQSDLNPQVISTVKQVQPVVEKIDGMTLYHVTGLDPFGNSTPDSTIRVVESLGSTKTFKSRVEKDHTLRGTKRAVIKNGDAYIGLGLRDNAQIVIIPIRGKKEGEKYIMVFHITFFEELPLNIKVRAMGIKYNDIVDMVTECDIPWDDSFIEGLSPSFLMTKSEEEIAEKIKQSVSGISL